MKEEEEAKEQQQEEEELRLHLCRVPAASGLFRVDVTRNSTGLWSRRTKVPSGLTSVWLHLLAVTKKRKMQQINVTSVLHVKMNAVFPVHCKHGRM